MRTQKLIFSAFIVFSALLPAHVFAAAPVASISLDLYGAKEASRSTPSIETTPGESTTFTIHFKNNGSVSWWRDARNFVGVYTAKPNYRDSLFEDEGWVKSSIPTKLVDARVRPGQTGAFTFILDAPLDPGTYHESFRLGLAKVGWITGGKFSIDIVVKPKPAFTTATGTTFQFAPGYKALMLLVSDHALSLRAGETKEFRVGFKNVGRTSWIGSGASPIAVKAIDAAPLIFRDASWSNNVVTPLSSDEVKPGQLAFFTIKLSAPRDQSGTFDAKFELAAGDDLVDGGEVEIPIEVQRGSVPAQIDQLHDSEFAASGPRGPTIRVGLLYSTDPIVIAADGTYTLRDPSDATLQQLSGSTTITYDFGAGIYTVTSGGYTHSSSSYPRFVPDDPSSTIFQITSYENRPTWDPTLNFNQFRGTLEIRYSPKTARLWVIEELPMEDYLRGFAETSNGSPYQYQKALVTAARTYALFVVSVGGKHQSEYFHLNTGGNDQVYKGYASELVRPNVVNAAEDTRGDVVTYNGEVVVTPYFSRSDGRTRSWQEVWGGTSHPWLISKPAPHDAGMDLWGHGVGISASDAVGRANDGADWLDILKYYYTGVEIKKLY